MARFVETFKDWIVSFPNRYKIIEDGQEKTVEIERDWEPDVEGTSNNERVMNELVKNITYDTDTVHTTESGTSVYICDLVGMKEFTEYSSSDSSFIPKISAQINTTNSNQLSKIRISGKDGSVSDYDLYTINNGVYSLLGANKLKPNTIVIIKIVSNGANKIAVVQYLMDDKLDKASYPGNAADLKADIDTKLPKGKFTGTADDLGQGVNLLSVNKLDKASYPGNAADLKAEIDSNLNKIIGLEYDGYITENKVKQVDKVYYDNATKKTYKCIVANSLNYADATKYEAISNNDLLLKLQNLANKNEFKTLKNFPFNTITLNTIPQEFSLTLEEMNASEYVVIYDVDFTSSSKSKFIFGKLARSTDGEYWIQTPSGEQINFDVSGSRLYLSAHSGSRPVCISSIFYR